MIQNPPRPLNGARLPPLPGCCGACQQGRKVCKVPDACLLPVDETPLGWKVSDAVAAVIFVGFIGALFLGLLS